MRRRSAWACLLAALFSICPLSCFKSFTNNSKKKKPNDPLLQSKCPVQANFGTTTDIHPRPDPTAPTMPAGAWITTPVPGQPQLGAIEPRQPGPFRWTSDKREQDIEGTPRKLQGKLEKSGDHWLLLTDEVKGGKVYLKGHPRLDMFEAGYAIHVEGRLLDNAGTSGPWVPYPLLMVDRVRLIQRGE